MSNTLNIARKEFADLANNKYLYIVLIIFLINLLMHLVSLYNFYKEGSISDPNFIKACLFDVMYLSSIYGGVTALMIGFSSMAGELTSGALNTLIAKPVYRDTVITGKLLGCIAYMLLFFILTAILYVSSEFILCGDVIAGQLLGLLARLPFIVIIALLYVMMFFLVSVLFRTLIDDNGMALTFSVLFYFVILIIPSSSVIISNIAALLGVDEVYLLGISRIIDPKKSMVNISNSGIFDPSFSIISALSLSWLEFAKFIVIVLALLALCYISFLRRDVR
ncbi:ABC-type transport system involved in multi-copper enzyme maturation, permease component [Methanocella conradii HZ254]|uniref:ABC-type transport system involved in multi-copper enzyme maturation, permease component n=1 Tax=Methanocella conradii (strain DSM 24694 / JCM 17849 / CGMCC 1.5162 / HZ254) TaxID=1041930 RepID=H8IAG9_METCZ|nr:ABC transporter permease subunit [Methanocella conradii]AFC99643.1 ABC-type transport system involved in multi-copper enzyme maturation, permease component [Methanocella conradii HZ254]